MSAQEQLTELQRYQIEALQAENKRLNDEIKSIKNSAFRLRLSDENLDKPLAEIEINYEIVKPEL